MFITEPYSNKTYYGNHLFDSGFMSDITVILKNENSSCMLKLHKLFLHYIPYFDMLLRNLKGNTLEVIVPNINITKKIIKKCYGFHFKLEDHEKLWYIKCCSFMCIKCEIDILKNLKIEPGDYDLLVSLASEFNYPDLFIELLAKNLPNDYRLEKLSDEILKMMREKLLISPFEIFDVVDNQITNNADVDNNLIKDINKYPYRIVHHYHNDDLYYSFDNGNMIVSCNGLMAAIISMSEYAKFSHDDRYLLIKTLPRRIEVRNVDSDQIINTIEINEPIDDFYQYGDDLYITSAYDHDIIDGACIYITKINIITLEKKEFLSINRRTIDHFYSRIYLTTPDKIIIIYDNHAIVYKIINDDINKILDYSFGYLECISTAVSEDGQYLACYTKGKKLFIVSLNHHHRVKEQYLHLENPIVMYFSQHTLILKNVECSYEVDFANREKDPIERYKHFPSTITDRIDTIINSR